MGEELSSGRRGSIPTDHPDPAKQERAAHRPRHCRVVADYQQVYPDPIAVRAGERVTLTGREDNWHASIWVWGIDPRGKEGWLPRDAVVQHGDHAVARYDFDARELTVSAGEQVTVERAESGWLWCVNGQGRQGWVPATHVACP